MIKKCHFYLFLSIFLISINSYAEWFIDLPSDGAGCKDAHIASNSPDNRCINLKSKLQRTNWRLIQPDGRLICQLSNADNIPDSSPRQNFEFFGCTPNTPVPDPTADLCKSKAGQSAGTVNHVIPGGGDSCPSSVQACPHVYNKEALKQWHQNPIKYSCVSSCQVIWDAETQYSPKDVTFYNKGQKDGEGDGRAYMPLRSLYTGKVCTSSDKQGAQPLKPDAVPEKVPPQKPQSQNNCPSGTTFGLVNNNPMCVKNAPPIDPNTKQPITSADDGKACLADCDKWKPDVKRPPGSPDGSDGKTGTGTGVDGDGQQEPSKNGGGTPDTKVEAKDENGSAVAGANKGFGEIKQDDIYQSKYKDKSFGSIWSDKKEQLLNTGFISGISESFPKVANGGTAPKITLDFSVFRLGSVSYEIPAYIIMFVKACLILTACLTARKIIWG